MPLQQQSGSVKQTFTGQPVFMWTKSTSYVPGAGWKQRINSVQRRGTTIGGPMVIGSGVGSGVVPGGSGLGAGAGTGVESGATGGTTPGKWTGGAGEVAGESGDGGTGIGRSSSEGGIRGGGDAGG